MPTKEINKALNCTPAVPGQVDLILNMEEEYYHYEGLRYDAASARKAIETILFNPSLGRVLIISIEGNPVGYAILTWCYSIEFQGTFALLDEFFILPSHRGKGVGSEILQRYVQPICRAEGIKAIRLEVEHHNARAKALYKRHGFAAHDRDIMTLWLDGNE